MSSQRLVLAPAGGGKTAYLVAQARARAVQLDSAPRVIVPSQLQVRAWRRRLAQAGGALGVRVSTFDALYREILITAGKVYTQLTDPVEYRLFDVLIADAGLKFYAPLVSLPGFVQVVRDMVRELKAGGVFPDKLIAALIEMGGESRLLELASLYDSYQRCLQERVWADAAGIGWLASEVLTERPDVASGWPCVMVDGFDDLTTVQIQVLRGLSTRVGELIVTLTGSLEKTARSLVHRRFNHTRERLERDLRVKAEPLPGPAAAVGFAPALAHLETALFRGEVTRCPSDGGITLIAAPDREGEVRVALRWLKARLVNDELRPGEVALLARSMEAYRPFVQQIAVEFGLPIYIMDGLPLRSNPAVVALLDLLRLALPGEQALAWRPTVAAWRSPYLDWSVCRVPEIDELVGIAECDAETLDCVARWASVVGGLAQWEEAFALLAEAGVRQEHDQETPPVPENLPTGQAALDLRDKFRRFVQRLTPPAGAQACRVFVGWLETLIGDQTPLPTTTAQAGAGPATDLGIVRQICAGPHALVERDLAALDALKDVLRGLVWAEEALACPAVTFDEFLADLAGAVRAAVYRLPLRAEEEAVLVAQVSQARGVSFRAVAVLGLAEGEFPTTMAEDPFLRDVDRQQLQSRFGLALDLSTEGAEAEYFYEAVTRVREQLLLTRPRIADNGAPWQASPFWEEVQRCVGVQTIELTGSSYPPAQEAASWPELLLGVSAFPQDEALWAWVAELDAQHCAMLQRGTQVLRQRMHAGDTLHPEVLPQPVRAYDGDLSTWEETFARRFGPHHVWSASRLESYRACPFSFFLAMLGLEPRAEPEEGLDGRQLGNIYHRVLERLYQSVSDPTDLVQLEEMLGPIANEVLDQAPRQEQFRATAWWAQTRAEILSHVWHTVSALHKLSGDYVPWAHELAFGFTNPPLVIEGPDGETLRLRGFIDRVDRAPDGRLRIVDYKTGGPWGYTNKAVQEGKKLQLALYALAAQQALGLGRIADGFYWHVQYAGWHLKKEHSKEWFRLSQSGAEQTMQQALLYAWEAVRGTRRGAFAPAPPDDGCRDFCPAASFCWQYSPHFW